MSELQLVFDRCEKGLTTAIEKLQQAREERHADMLARAKAGGQKEAAALL